MSPKRSPEQPDVAAGADDRLDDLAQPLPERRVARRRGAGRRRAARSPNAIATAMNCTKTRAANHRLRGSGFAVKRERAASSATSRTSVIVASTGRRSARNRWATVITRVIATAASHSRRLRLRRPAAMRSSSRPGHRGHGRGGGRRRHRDDLGQRVHAAALVGPQRVQRGRGRRAPRRSGDDPRRAREVAGLQPLPARRSDASGGGVAEAGAVAAPQCRDRLVPRTHRRKPAGRDGAASALSAAR